MIDPTIPVLGAERDELRAENERLRELLRLFSDHWKAFAEVCESQGMYEVALALMDAAPYREAQALTNPGEGEGR